MLDQKAFKDSMTRLYGAFNKSCSPAAAAAAYAMLGGDNAEADSEFLADAVGRLMHLRRLPDNVGLALADLWTEWKAARAAGDPSGIAGHGQADAAAICPHCGGRGWIKVYCTDRPGVLPALVRCSCNADPKLQALTAYTLETAADIPGAATANPWEEPKARVTWIKARHNDTAPVQEKAHEGDATAPASGFRDRATFSGDRPSIGS